MYKKTLDGKSRVFYFWLYNYYQYCSSALGKSQDLTSVM